MARKPQKNRKLTEVRMQLTMPQSLKKRLDEEADKQHISVNALIRMAVIKWLEIALL